MTFVADSQARLRSLPAVDRVLESLAGDAVRPLAVGAARAAIESARTRVLAGDSAPTFDHVVADARARLAAYRRGLLQEVLNATGVIIHTNFGRVPLGEDQVAAVQKVASGYSNLEYDLDKGARGSRYSHARALISALTGADAALIVNNNAAAVLLVLSTLSEAKEVVVSRGELVEIGGEFRIPDVMEASGARLVEIGTTNRTHLNDYERAVTGTTGAILKVHPSNYRVVGFTKEVPARDLARLARSRAVPFVHDLGSGMLSGAPEWMGAEPLVEDALADGADVVTFSGDKLLGGPQAGIIVGHSEMIERMSANPLLRAVRPDKMTLAALEATLRAYLEGKRDRLPLWRMAGAPVGELEQRALALTSALRGRIDDAVKVEALASRSVSGGGSLPGTGTPSWAVSLAHAEHSADAIAGALRVGPTPVVGRIEEDRVLLDLRTVPPERDRDLEDLVVRALARVTEQ